MPPGMYVAGGEVSQELAKCQQDIHKLKEKIKQYKVTVKELNESLKESTDKVYKAGYYFGYKDCMEGK